MRAVALALLSTFALAACSGEPAEPAAPEAPAAPATILGGVDLTKPVRALGTEPFWSVDLDGSTMTYTNIDQAKVAADQPEPQIQGTLARYAAQSADGQALEVVLIATECSDGMSDRLYPLVAQVTVGALKLSGCAAGRDALMAAPESGPVGGGEAAQPTG